MARHAQLVQQILEFIQARNLAPGDKLPPERQLAELLGTSRNSVREALRALAQQGHLQSRPGDGTYVQQPDAEPAAALQQALESRKRRLHEVFALRRILESGLAELAAENATASDLTRLKALVYDQQRARETGQDGQHFDAAFHLQVARATHNQVLLDVMLALNTLLDESRCLDLQRPARVSVSPEAHLAIIDAIEARDPQRARKEMERHLRAAESLSFAQDLPSAASALADETSLEAEQ